MSRMLKFQVADGSNNNAASGRQPAFVNIALKAMLTAALCVSVSAFAAPATKTAVKPATAPTSSVVKAQKDPLAGDTWHADAQAGTWPGTLVFDSAKKNVTLAPVGAQPMDASYTYTVKPSLTANVIEGTLRMTNSAKQVSESTFRIEGKVLTLMYANGQRPETYVRMTVKEEEAEKARLQKMISEGRIRPLK